MVVISCPATRPTCVIHDRVALPLTWTVHAPHIAMPQPYFVPVKPIVSRMTHKRGVSSSTFTECVFPLTLRESMATPHGRNLIISAEHSSMFGDDKPRITR